MDKKQLEKYVLSLPNTKLTFPFGEEVAVYKVSIGGESDGDKMFALIPEDKTPVSISLKCDPQLAMLLREKYESVMAGYHLNKKHWNTILMTGQMSDEEVRDLILHSYNLVTGTQSVFPDFS